MVKEKLIDVYVNIIYFLKNFIKYLINLEVKYLLLIY